MNRIVPSLSALVGACLLVLVGCSGVTDSPGPKETSQPSEVARRFDPTAARTPTPSKSLTLAADWQPPAPTRTAPARVKARVQPKKQWGAPFKPVSATAADAEFKAVARFAEPLRPVPGSSSAEETAALAAAVRDHSGDDRGLAGLERFLATYPASRWAPAVHLNFGTVSYEHGYFQEALAHWKAAWDLAKAGGDPVSHRLANLGLAESAKMNARIGRQTELEALLDEAQKRNLTDEARRKIESASEGAWMMRHRPGVSFQCGPFALLNVAAAKNLDVTKKRTAFLEKAQSPSTGFSIPEVHRMSAQLGLDLQIAKREVGAAIITPAVVHWKLGHFAAIVQPVNGAFLVKDPTFTNDTVMTAKAFDHEASGYFLVPAGPLPQGWSRATPEETAELRGKGLTSVIPEPPDDAHQVGGDCQQNRGSLAMATYRFQTLFASLYIVDTPITYQPAFGPDIRVDVKYSQRGFGKFVTNWNKWIDPKWFETKTYGGCGGGCIITVQITHPGHYPEDEKRGAALSSLPGDGFKYTFPDGHEEYYEQVIANHDPNEPGGGDGPPPTAYLSRVVDPQGNAVTVEYDANRPRQVSRLVDATGLPTDFHYDHPDDPDVLTSIEDPFGRTATFSYSLVAEALRLQSTEDPYGIISSFEYNDAGAVKSITTPYGTTRFGLSEPYVHTGENLIRYLEATDPMGQSERVEFNISASTGIPWAPESPQPNSAVINFSGAWTNYRNTFYWDKLATKLAPGDYKKARIYHWVHLDSNQVDGYLESEVPPLESRIFYNYPAQPYPNWTPPSVALPSAIGRVVKDAAGNNQTQAVKFAYNAQYNVTSVTDPALRQTSIEYAANGIDPIAVKQLVGGTWTTMSSATYGVAPPHSPATTTDGAGKTMSFTYSATTGQVATITNPKSEVVTFGYGTSSTSPDYQRLVSVSGDVPGGNRAFTYDAFGRVRTTSTTDGQSLTYDYDSLDRLRVVTYPDGSFEQFEYEDHSLIATKDREGRWTRHMYNPLRQRVVTQDPTLRTTQFQWCRCGELKKFVDGSGNVTEWERDVAGRVTKKKYANGTFELYTYDLSGRVSTETDAMSRVVTYTYGVDDRLAKKDYADTSTPDVTYTHDAYFPRVASRTDGSGTTAFSYHPFATSTNGAGQLATVNGPLANDTQKYTYDELGRPKKLEIVDDATGTVASFTEEYTFDARGRVTTVANDLGSTTYAFVGQSPRPSTVALPNGMQTHFDYFGATTDFALKQIKNLSSGSSPSILSQFDYTYRPDRAIDTWKVDQGAGATTWSFGYDGARQLTKADRRDASQTLLESLSYAYDKAGNRTQAGTGTTAPKNYETNPLNQLLSERDHGRTTFAGFVDEPSKVKVNGQPAKVTSTDGGAPFKFEALVDLSAGANLVTVEARDGSNNVSTKNYAVTTTGASKTFEYDGNGNLRFEKQPNGTVLREYRWDQQNRLVKELHGTHESAYEYDGADRRWRITEKENGVQTKQDTFVWCGGRICQKRSGSTVVRSYFGQGFRESGATSYFTTRDHLGSVREVVGNDGTTVASRLSYDPWGKSTETGSGAKSDFTYTGHYFDGATGLNLAQYRAYDPVAGRWLSRDPAGIDGGSNLYAYAAGNPVSFKDTTGLSPQDALLDAWWLPPGLKIFGGGARMRANGISMMSNDATFEAGMAKANCGANMMAAGAGVIGADAQIIVAVAGALPSLGRAAAEGGSLRAFARAEPKHHVFPQQFRPEFERLRIPIDRFTLQMPRAVHSEIHAMGWNDDWAEFLAGDPSAPEAYEFAANMMHEYDLFRYLPFREY